MRLREVKNKIKAISDDSGRISIPIKQSFGNYYIITDTNRFFSLLLLLKDQAWNDIVFTNIQTIIDEKDPINNVEIMLDSNQYSHLSAYVDRLNEKIPFFFKVVDSVSSDQSEYDINIKLSNNITTINDLSTLITEIKKLEKYANLDGKGFSFSGFDTGSNWITIATGGGVVYGFIMACLKIAQEYLKTKEHYYKTKEAKIHYEMSLKDDKKYSESDLKKYCEEYCNYYLKNEVNELANSIGEFNGNRKNEIAEKAKNTTKCLAKIIGNDNEIHISLNNSPVISETDTGSIEINYDILRSLKDKENNQELQLSTGEDNTES